MATPLWLCGAGEIPYGSAASQSAADGSALQKEKIVRLLREVTT